MHLIDRNRSLWLSPPPYCASEAAARKEGDKITSEIQVLQNWHKFGCSQEIMLKNLSPGCDRYANQTQARSGNNIAAASFYNWTGALEATEPSERLAEERETRLQRNGGTMRNRAAEIEAEKAAEAVLANLP